VRPRPLIAPPVAVSLLPILTGCHLSRIPSPALSMAAVALSVGGLLGTHLLIALGTKYRRSIDTPEPDRARSNLQRRPVRSPDDKPAPPAGTLPNPSAYAPVRAFVGLRQAHGSFPHLYLAVHRRGANAERNPEHQGRPHSFWRSAAQTLASCLKGVCRLMRPPGA
jgi:hypothetical protein